MRLDRFLAEAGCGTRSEVRRMITSGRVTVSGKVIRDGALKVDEEHEQVALDGKTVRYVAFEYFMLNKPQGVISARKDESRQHEVCVTDLIDDKIRNDLFPVGRLDKDTEGLLLITNDGQLSHRLLSPKHHVDKTYEVRLDGPLTESQAKRITSGVDIGDETPTLPCMIEQLSKTHCRITIQEGRYHQIKRMFQTEGLSVIKLKRLSMGPLVLDETLKPGKYRRLSKSEIQMLKSCTVCMEKQFAEDLEGN